LNFHIRLQTDNRKLSSEFSETSFTDCDCTNPRSNDNDGTRIVA